MKIFSLIAMLASISLLSCKEKTDGRRIAGNYLMENGWVYDHTIDSELAAVMEGINVLAREHAGRYFVLEHTYDPADTTQVLLVPYRRRSGTGTSSAFSSIENRLVFICPPQIKGFVETNSLSDSSDIKGYLGIVLLHELGHFALGISGSFDEGAALTAGEGNEGSGEETEIRLGEVDEVERGTEPILMTADKRMELRVDSLAAQWVKAGISGTDPACFSLCMDVQLALNGAEFMLFGMRVLQHWGSPYPNTIRDQSWTHPNIELRMAFMNYYLNPTDEKRRQIDGYLYQREVEPVHRQTMDPRIYQGGRDESLTP